MRPTLSLPHILGARLRRDGGGDAAAGGCPRRASPRFGWLVSSVYEPRH
jgi:hypothetical protein